MRSSDLLGRRCIRMLHVVGPRKCHDTPLAFDARELEELGARAHIGTPIQLAAFRVSRTRSRLSRSKALRFYVVCGLAAELSRDAGGAKRRVRRPQERVVRPHTRYRLNRSAI